VDDSSQRNIRVYDFRRDGTLGNGRIFGEEPGANDEGVPDGMRVDRAGNLFVTGPGGIWIWDPEGHHLGTVLLPEQLQTWLGAIPIGRRCTSRPQRRCINSKRIQPVSYPICRNKFVQPAHETVVQPRTRTVRIFNRSRNRSPRNARVIWVGVFLATSLCLIWKCHTIPAQAADVPKDNASLVDAFRNVEVSSVSDALEQALPQADRNGAQEHSQSVVR
jgi:hypothetical protein